MYDRGLWRYIRFFENPVDFINFPVYRDGCEFSGIFPENPVGLAGMLYHIVVRHVLPFLCWQAFIHQLQQNHFFFL